MRVTFYKSAGVLIESGGSRLLCDPWLKDGAYYGAWAHVPPCDVGAAEIGPVDGIYITHLHPDHCAESTLATFPRDTPVFIHHYAFPYLRDAIVRLGFRVVELPHGPAGAWRFPSGLTLTIYAADNCDPMLCGQFFGCDAKVGAERPGSAQIDSLAVITDGRHTVVNVNDCPLELARSAAASVMERFTSPEYPTYGQAVDLLLVNYVGAGPFPQCMGHLSHDEKLNVADAKREQFYQQAEDYVRLFRPKAFMPFAGTYTLAGKLAPLNQYRGVPGHKEAACELAKRLPESRCVYLETRQKYDVGTGEVEGVAWGFTDETRADYEAEVLSTYRMDYESDPMPDPLALHRMLVAAGERFRKQCEAVGYTPQTRTYVRYVFDECYRLPAGKEHGRVVSYREAKLDAHVILSADPRMLVWLLNGRAHWQDASIGSHITFERKPDRYDRGLEFCLNSLHV